VSCDLLRSSDGEKPPPDCPADSRAAPKRLHRHNYLQVLVNISAIACGCARDAGHDTVAALTVPFGDTNTAAPSKVRPHVVAIGADQPSEPFLSF
jgi:hypothetical protein